MRGRSSRRRRPHQRDDYIARIRDQADLADDPEPAAGSVRDPKDDYIVALAREAAVDAIVTGDRDLLDAGIDEPPVVTPRQLLGMLAESGGGTL